MEQTDCADTLDGTGAPRLLASIDAARIGRYAILRKLGEGGMGVVYAAYDDVLDRKLAIKLLHPRSRAGTHGARLLREAQGLARLSHPNVVQIYEIGEHDGAVWMAMEFVAGQTLGAWLREQPRSRAEILTAFLVAGRGLAAAHAARLIHRDFKPDNVMIADDGQVKVMDFGLVRAAQTDDAKADELGHSGLRTLDASERELTASLSQHDSLGVDLTKTGSIMGTPAYMAPEQHFGRPTDARSDQFSFCVALWEALHGERPFPGESIAALAFNVTQGKLAEPARDADVPGWLRKVIERGLALDPEQRWPSMDALLAALVDDPTRRRRRVLAVIGVASLAFGAYSLQHAAQRRASAAEQAARAEAVAACSATAREIAAVWDDSERARIDRAFAASELPFAADASARTRTLLDDYAQAWSDARTGVCVDAEVDGSLDASVAERARACLAERRAALASLVGLLGEADDARVLQSVSSAAALPAIADCRDLDKLARMLPPPNAPEVRARVEALRALLARVRSLDSMGEYELGVREAADALHEAEQIGWPPLIAAAHYAVGELATASGDYSGAREAYEQAMSIAGEAGDDAQVLDAAVALVYVVGVGLELPDDGLRVARLAEVLRGRLGLEGALADAVLHNNRGTIHDHRGELELALAEFERALEIYEARLPPAHPSISIALNNIGTIHARSGRVDAALAAFSRTLEIREASLPPGHPRFAAAYENLGAAYNLQGEYELAAAALERALAINEANLPTNHLDIASNLTNLGNTHYQRDDYTHAVELFERALSIRQAVLPPESRLIASAHHNLGLALDQLERHEQAVEHHGQALRILEATLEPDNPRLGDMLIDHGKALVRAGRTDVGLAALERALQLRETDDADPSSVADLRWELAVLIWDHAPERRAEARALMQAAGELYREAGQQESAAQVDAWLEAHR